MALLAFILAALASGAEPEQAQEAQAELIYVRQAGAENCPTESQLRAAVAARLGYDPFKMQAPTALLVTIGRSGSELLAKFELSEKGREPRLRDLRSPGQDCAELASALELAMSIALDPLILLKPAAPKPEPPPPLQAAPQSRFRPLGYGASLGIIGSAGATPSLALGGALGFEARWPSFSLGVEGRGDFPASTSVGEGGQVQTRLFLGSLVPCFWLGIFGGCALVSGGALEASGVGLVDGNQFVSPYAALGIRALVDVPLGARLSLRLQGDLRASLVSTTLLVNNAPFWSSPPLDGTLGAILVLRFL